MEKLKYKLDALIKLQKAFERALELYRQQSSIASQAERGGLIKSVSWSENKTKNL